MNPIDLLPIKRPLEDNIRPKPVTFYENVVQWLIPDVIKMMMTGIPIDLNKVKDLEKVVDDVLITVKETLKNNPIIQEYLSNKKKKFLKEKGKTEEDFYKPFKRSNKIHRDYVVKEYLKEINQSFDIDTYSIKDISNIGNILNDRFLLALAEDELQPYQNTIDIFMHRLAQEKADLYNSNLGIKIEDEEFNPGSTKQKQELFTMLGISSEEKTEKGQEQWNRTELEKLLNTDNEQIKEIVQALLDFSNAAIIRNNFIEAFYNYSYKGRLYGNFKLFGAKSFRLTSNNPNLLNMPSTGSIYAKPIKRCFTAFNNKVIYQVDYSALTLYK